MTTFPPISGTVLVCMMIIAGKDKPGHHAKSTGHHASKTTVEERFRGALRMISRTYILNRAPRKCSSTVVLDAWCPVHFAWCPSLSFPAISPSGSQISARSTTIGLCHLYGPGAHRRVWEEEKMKKPRPGLKVTLGRLDWSTPWRHLTSLDYTQLIKTRHKIATKLDKIEQAFGALEIV